MRPSISTLYLRRREHATVNASSLVSSSLLVRARTRRHAELATWVPSVSFLIREHMDSGGRKGGALRASASARHGAVQKVTYPRKELQNAGSTSVAASALSCSCAIYCDRVGVAWSGASSDAGIPRTADHASRSASVSAKHRSSVGSSGAWPDAAVVGWSRRESCVKAPFQMLFINRLAKVADDPIVRGADRFSGTIDAARGHNRQIRDLGGQDPPTHSGYVRWVEQSAMTLTK
jgi:hypothetical protein